MANQLALYDENSVPTLMGESSSVPGELARIKVNPATGAQLVEVTGGSAASGAQLGEPAAYDELGQIAIGIRHDAEGTPIANDGDFHPFLFNEFGRLKVSTMPGAYDVVTGNLTTIAQTLALDVTRASNVVMHVKNLTVTAMVAGAFAFEGSLDSTNGTDGTWFSIQVVRSNANTIETATGTLSLAAGAGLAYSWEASVNAYNWIRVRCTTSVTTNSIATWRLQRGSYATEPIPAAQATATQPVSGTVTSNIGTSGLTVYTDSATNLGSTATFTGTSRDGGATPAYNLFVASAYADQAGTLIIQKSTDNTNWREAKRIAVAQATAEEISVRCTARYYRVVYTNGATIQTVFSLTSAYQRI